MNIKSVFNNWNMQTQLWLKRIVYERVRVSSTAKTFIVFGFSAVWHGFYPGTYMTFGLCAVMVQAGRGIRNTIRPLFQSRGVWPRVFYDAISWFVTSFVCFGYTAIPFFVCTFEPSVQFYK